MPRLTALDVSGKRFTDSVVVALAKKFTAVERLADKAFGDHVGTLGGGAAAVDDARIVEHVPQAVGAEDEPRRVGWGSGSAPSRTARPGVRPCCVRECLRAMLGLSDEEISERPRVLLWRSESEEE